MVYPLHVESKVFGTAGSFVYIVDSNRCPIARMVSSDKESAQQLVDAANKCWYEANNETDLELDISELEAYERAYGTSESGDCTVVI